MLWLRFVDVGIYLALAVYLGFHWHSDTQHVAGVVIALIAFWLWMLARRQLGESFAVRAEAKALVTTGIYSRIRNPIYVFGGLAFVGIFLALGWYFWLAFFVVMSFGQYFRIRREEQVLTQAFGNQYLAYKAKTWF